MIKQQPIVITNKTNILTCENQIILSVSVLGTSIKTVSPDRELIPRRKKKKKISEIPIIGNNITQDPDNLSKNSKVGSSTDGKKLQ